LTEVDFDIVVLSEIWTANIEFYSNILFNSNFYHDLPSECMVRGIGMFVKKKFEQSLKPQFKISSTETNKLENIRTEIVNGHSKFIVGGKYWHPNQDNAEFTQIFETTLGKLAKKYPCIIAGDVNTDLAKTICELYLLKMKDQR
jgi:exonuclease III